MNARDEPAYLIVARQNGENGWSSGPTVVRALVERIDRDAKSIAEHKAARPRTITTVEELDALPAGSVIRADNGEVFEKQTDGPYYDGPHDWQSFEGTFWNGETFVFPATVLHEPQP